MDIEAVEAAIENQNTGEFLASVEELHHVDLATVYEDISDEDRDFYTEHIGPVKFAQVLPELPDTLIESSLERFKPADQKTILGALLDDDRADILQDVKPEARNRYLALLRPEDMEATRSLLRFSEDTAGGRMTTQAARITLGMTVKEALDILREDKDSTESLSRIYVVDAQGRLKGKVRLRELAFNSWDTLVDDLMEDVELYILSSADQEEAAQMFSRYDMSLLPVVDEYDRLLGVITHDDILEILEEESTEDFEKMSGIAGEQSEETYLNTPVATHFRRRFPWLLTLGLLATSSGYVMLRFEHVLSSVYLLALYLPMIVAAGGNTGGQAATMIIRAMSLGELEAGSTAKVIAKELALGVLLGVLLGGCVALGTLFILPAFHPPLPDGISLSLFAFAASIALAAQITSSTLIGAVLPIGARAIKLDPAVLAAPVITTVVDFSGMLIYFTAARTILNLS